MTVRIFFINKEGDEDTLCKQFNDEEDVDVEVNVLKSIGCQVMAWMVV